MCLSALRRIANVSMPCYVAYYLQYFQGLSQDLLALAGSCVITAAWYHVLYVTIKSIFRIIFSNESAENIKKPARDEISTQPTELTLTVIS